jgi:hypothetical protein
MRLNYEKIYFLGCDTVKSSRYLLTFSVECVAPMFSTLKMEAERSSETLVNIHHTA